MLLYNLLILEKLLEFWDLYNKTKAIKVDHVKIILGKNEGDLLTIDEFGIILHVYDKKNNTHSIFLYLYF